MLTVGQERVVSSYLFDLMPERIRLLRAMALHDLHEGPRTEPLDEDHPIQQHGGWSGYESALHEICDWVLGDMPGALWFDPESDWVGEEEPETDLLYTIEGESVIRIERSQLKRIAFGALVTDGGL